MCCDKAYFDFNNASTIILEGDNGQGKSAVLEAVAVCLAEHKRADSFKDFILSFTFILFLLYPVLFYSICFQHTF